MEKRFPPSAERLAKARREGKVAKSQLLTTAGSLLALVSVLALSVSWVRDGTLVQWFQYKVLSPGEALKNAATAATIGSGVALISVALGALVAHLFQTRALFSLSHLRSGYRRVGLSSFAARLRDAAKECAIGVVRCVVVVIVTGPVVVGFIVAAPHLLSTPLDYSLDVSLAWLKVIVVRALTVILLMGCLGFVVARRRLQQELMMSWEELRQEQRDDEGDPHMKSFRRGEAQALSMAELERRVKSAKVVVVRRGRR